MITTLTTRIANSVAPNLYDLVEFPGGYIEHFIERRGHNRGGFYLDAHIMRAGAALEYAVRTIATPSLIRLDNAPREGRVIIRLGVDCDPYQVLSAAGDSAYLPGAAEALQIKIEASVLCHIRLIIYPQPHPHGTPPHRARDAA